MKKQNDIKIKVISKKDGKSFEEILYSKEVKNIVKSALMNFD